MTDAPPNPELLTYLGVSAISFLLGVMVGWATSNQIDSVEQSSFRRIMALLLLSAYIISVLAEISLAQYQTPMLLHGIMGAIIGYIFSQEKGFNINIGGRKKK